MDQKLLSDLTGLVNDWIAVFNKMQLPYEYDTVLGTCVDPGFPSSAHVVGVESTNVIDGRIEELTTQYNSAHRQISNNPQFSFDLRQIAAYGETPTDTNISNYLRNGIAQVTIENEILIVGIPGDVYSNLLEGEGPAFGLPFSEGKGVNPLNVLAFNLALATYNGAVKQIIAGAHGKCGLYKANASSNLLEILEKDRQHGIQEGKHYDQLAQAGSYDENFPRSELLDKAYGFDDLITALRAYMPNHNIALFDTRPKTVDRPH